MSSELVALFNGVKSALATASPGTAVVFGRRETTKQVNQGSGGANRIVFAYGTPEGDMFDETAPRWIGQIPRVVKDRLEQFTVTIWAFDASAPTDESVQHDAVLALHELWRVAVFKVAENRVTVGRAKLPDPDRNERTFGVALQVSCTIRSPVRDRPLVADVDAAPLNSTTTLTELDQTVTVNT